MKISAAVVALSCCALAPASFAQSPASNKTPTTARAKSPTAAYDPLAEARRVTAITLVTSLADEARSFHDEMLRARVQARAADALWETDQERARALFLRAWDAADQADREGARRVAEDARRQYAEGQNIALTRPPNLRQEVLRLAAKRDRALGDQLLAKFEEQRKQDGRDATTSDRVSINRNAPDFAELGAAMTDANQRLELARTFLQSGDAERALQIAAPELGTANSNSLSFLADLREKSPDAADKVFAQMLAGVGADPRADANLVSRLSSYVFTPHLEITVSRDGGFNTSSNGRTAPPENFPAALRASFLGVAAQVLLRPAPPADQDQSFGGRAATYFVIARLLPLFEQYLPAATPALRAQLTALTPDVPQDMRDDDNSRWLTEGLKPASADAPARDEVQDALDRLDRAKTDEERDSLYTQAAMAAAARRDSRARDYAAKVKDEDARAQLYPYIDFMFARAAIDKKDVPEILRLAREGAMTHLQNVWALTEASRLSLKENRPLALDLLEEAWREAQRVNGADADRPRAALAVLTPLYALDPERVWSLAPELVKSANAANDFTGEDGRVGTKFRTKRQSSIHSSTVDSFNLKPLFQLLARADMNRAVELAKGFTNEAPRASATLAVAATVLAEPAPKPKVKS